MIATVVIVGGPVRKYEVQEHTGVRIEGLKKAQILEYARMASVDMSPGQSLDRCSFCRRYGVVVVTVKIDAGAAIQRLCGSAALRTRLRRTRWTVDKLPSGVAVKSLTVRQAAILKFIEESMLRNKRPPTFREIGRHMGIRSTNGVMDHLNRLEHKGYIRRTDLLSRGITLVRSVAQSETRDALYSARRGEIPGSFVLALPTKSGRVWRGVFFPIISLASGEQA